MSTASLLKQQPALIEIGQNWLRARHGDQGIEILLKRNPDGRLDTQSKENAVAALKDFLKPKTWLPRLPAWCAIGARGVSLRRISLPGGTKDEIYQRLLLQIEAEFPLSPDELAWGYQSLSHANSAASRHDLLIAAVKKELVADYQDILHQAGTEPVFTLAAIARWNECGQPKESFAMLDLGAQQAEFTVFKDAVPDSSRILFLNWPDTSGPADGDVESLAKSIRNSLGGSRLYVSGNGVSKVFTDRLALSLGNECKCQVIETPPGPGNSAVISGLEKFATSGRDLPLAIRMEPIVVATAKFATLDWKKWGVRAGGLLLAVLLLPYLEALILKPHLEAKVAAFKKDAERLKVIDRELEFLQKLKLSQPPYLDVLFVFSKSAPQGTRFDSLSLNSHGQVAMRCALRDGQQVSDFRNKLIASGFFTNVVVEEQTPTMDRQHVNVRMSGQERSLADMVAASARLAAEDATRDKKTTNAAPATASPNLTASRKEAP